MLDDVLYVLKQKVMALLKNKMRIISWFMATSPGYPADFDLSKPIQKKRYRGIFSVNCSFIQSGKL